MTTRQSIISVLGSARLECELLELCQQATIKKLCFFREEKDLIKLTKICANQQQLLLLMLLSIIRISYLFNRTRQSIQPEEEQRIYKRD
jgi:hypothetical protein